MHLLTKVRNDKLSWGSVKAIFFFFSKLGKTLREEEVTKHILKRSLDSVSATQVSAAITPSSHEVSVQLAHADSTMSCGKANAPLKTAPFLGATSQSALAPELWALLPSFYPACPSPT